MMIVVAGIAAVLGMMTWSLAEYWIHRKLGHEHRKNIFATEHLRHHAEGDYFAPAWKKGAAAVVVVAVLAPPAALLVGTVAGVVYIVSFVATWLTYEWLHWRAHVSPGVRWYGRWLRRNHFAHHFHGAAFNHGVTSSTWDHVFGTHKPPPEVIRVPRKLAMVWLVDENGSVRSQHVEGWALR